MSFSDTWRVRMNESEQLLGRLTHAIMDNLEMHHCRDVLLFMIHLPRWEFVYQPRYAAYLNFIEPWWKVLRSLAFKCKRFETWQQV
jgi:hypothetical protein